MALAMFPVMQVIANLVSGMVDGQPYPVFEDARPSAFFVGVIVNFLINGGMSEEFGWRGNVLLQFQSKWSALVSSVVLGVIWVS